MQSDLDIVVLPGDGIGIEVIDSAILVLQATQGKVGGFRLNLQKYEAGAATYQKAGVALPDTTVAAVEAGDAVLLGAMGHPDVKYPDGTGIAPQLELRFKYGLYAGVRPIKLMPGIAGALADPRAEGIDLVILRESTEGLLAAISEGLIVDDQYARDSMIITRKTSTKLFDFAFGLAAKRKARGSHGRVTCIDKADVLRSFAFFRQVFERRSALHPDICADACYVDAAALNLVRSPWNFDVLVTENMFGDILSDLGAGLVGGMGMAPSADIGDDHAVFQPSHGTAPDIAGTGRANPTAAVLSAAMMLDWLADRKDSDACRVAAATINAAVEAVYRERRVRPYEFGGTHSTQAIAAGIAEAVKEQPLSVA